MKKLLYILLSVTLFASCSSSDDDKEIIQDYTSFQVKNDNTTGTYHNVVVGYRLADNTLKRIATLGNIAAGKTSDKIQVTDSNIKQIELFNNSIKSDGSLGTTRPLGKINLTANQNNVFTIPKDFINIESVDPTDPTQYPIN